MKRRTHQFTAKIAKRDFGRMYYTVLFAPKRLEKELDLKANPRLRIEGKVGDIPFSCAFQPNGGDWYLILSKKVLRDGGWKLGDRVTMEFQIADQDAVDVPADLMAELRRRNDVFMSWEAMTPGRRRGLAHRVGCAKREDTRERRILEVIDEIMSESKLP
ncbi:MAG: YdeI/OmpD-associated family protein [Verrucomicrobiota bacterium]